MRLSLATAAAISLAFPYAAASDAKFCSEIRSQLLANDAETIVRPYCRSLLALGSRVTVTAEPLDIVT